jgi:8-oxo-dGTP pyrophosphatase MutT (NUDIX family)/phosphohistidine phosphatase SixA
MPNNKPPDSKESKLILAAGAVAWRPGRDGGEPEILLVHRKKYDDWSLPKGKTEPGEPLPLTAVREVFEEGGAQLILGRRLTSMRYQVGGRPKRVHWWAARVSGVDEAAVPNSEVDEVSWAARPEAGERASYEHDVRVLDDFARCPADTVPLILLRHATAVPRTKWEGDDGERPLDSEGRAQAKLLAPLLAAFAPRARVISSAATRCLDSVGPYAELTGAEVRVEQALQVRSSETDPAASAALIAETIGAGEPTVVCAHRENVHLLQAAAIGALGPPDGTLLPKEWADELPTAGFWVLHVTPPPATPVCAPRPRWWWFRRASAAADADAGQGGGALVAADRYDLSDA